MRRSAFFALFIVVFAFLSFSASLYLVNGNEEMYLGKVYTWSQPYVKLQDVGVALDLQWSYKGRSGAVTNGKDFISFNTSTHMGIYDAIYTMNDVASGTSTPYLSLKALEKIADVKVESDAVGYLLLKKSPTLVVNGALLYGNKFTVFFKEKPSTNVIKVTSSGMVSTVTIFPIKISPKYVSSHSPLVVETKGKNSIVFRITYTSKVQVLYALGFPSLPFQRTKSVQLTNGITYQSVDSTSLNGKRVRIGMVKIPPASGKMKIVYPLRGIGEKSLITSMINATSLVAVGFSNTQNGFISYDKILSYSSSQNGPLLVWNDRKFDIIETSPTISVNIGNVPFSVDEINDPNGSVVLYTEDYGPAIPKDDKKMYFEVKNGEIVGMRYVPHPGKGEYILTITKDYQIFLKDVQLGDDFYIFTSLSGKDTSVWKGIIQGKCLLVNNSKKARIWPEEEKKCESNDFLIAALKKRALYLIKAECNQEMNANEISDIMFNMGFSKAMILESGKSISMIVNGKDVEFNDYGLYPVGFGVEIDKTTGGA